MLQLAQMVYYGREYKEQNKRLKRTRQKTESTTMAVRSALKQPEKNAQRNSGEKGWTCYYCGKEGNYKWDCPQASKPPPTPCPVCKGSYWRRDCPQRRRSQWWDSQDNQDWMCPGVPTQTPTLITAEEPQVLVTVGPISQFSFGYSGKFLLTHWGPWSAFLPNHYHNGTVWISQRLLFQLSF